MRFWVVIEILSETTVRFWFVIEILPRSRVTNVFVIDLLKPAVLAWSDVFIAW